MENLEELYRNRFDEQERAAKDKIWKVLCGSFFQQRIPQEATVLDLACGYGEFIRHISADRRLAVDINGDSQSFLPENVEFHSCSADHLTPIDEDSVDLTFVSNFFEHLHSKAEMDRVLSEIFRVLKPGGRLMALQPNIRYAPDLYWDFYDHHLPLSHLSAKEGFEKNGYEVIELIPRFIPWSTKSRLPQHPILVRLYLASPWIWPLLGKQFFILARKPSPDNS